jgi:hypothetical protein
LIKYLALIFFLLISCHSTDIKTDNDAYKKCMDKYLLNQKQYDTTTEMGKLKKDYDNLVKEYKYLRIKSANDSLTIVNSKLFFKLLEHPNLFDGDTIPCGLPLGILGFKIGTPLYIKGRIDNKHRGLSSTSNYCVQYVNGNELNNPVFIRFSQGSRLPHNFYKLKNGTKIDFFGYETGRYVGNPPGINVGSKLNWQFWKEFVVLDIISMDGSSLQQ